jgi:hypothetical protein
MNNVELFVLNFRLVGIMNDRLDYRKDEAKLFKVGKAAPKNFKL